MDRRRVGKLLRKKGSGSTLLPRAVMSFWTILSCCFTSKTIREDTIRPRSYVGINGQQVSALFDTGSAISLIDSRYLCLVRADQNKGPSIRLCGANGTPLTNKGKYEVNIKVNGRLIKQHVHCIENLQVPCIFCLLYTSPSPRNRQ